MDRIKDVASNHRITPDPDVWKKLNYKLKAKRAKRRLLVYRNISIAAILVAVLSVTVVFTLYLGKHDPKVFSSNEQYRPVMLEELVDNVDDPIYDVKYIDQLNTAYAKIGF